MARPKGTKKTGGRKKGTPNKTTAELKKWVHAFVSENLDEIKTEFSEMEVDQKINVIMKLLPYVLPKQTETKLSIDEDFQKAVKESVENINDLFK